MSTTDRDYADKRWLEEHERMPLPVFIMDIFFAILAAVGVAALIAVGLSSQ